MRRFVTRWPPAVVRASALHLPFASSTVDAIYTSHMLEHLKREEAFAAVAEFARVLKPLGILRIVVPDLRKAVADYLNDDSDEASHQFVSRLLLKSDWREWLHPGAHHCTMYDARSLAALLRSHAFCGVQARSFRESAIPGIEGVEHESRASESLYVEAERATGEANLTRTATSGNRI